MTEKTSHHYLWRTASAWHITLYLGLNSFIMYVMVSWLPTIAVDRGFNEHEAGIIQGLSQLGTALPALVLIPAMSKINDKRLLATSLPALVMCSLIGIFFTPEYTKLWAVLLGFGAGGGFIIALSLIGIRTHNADQTAALSGKSQCVGYLIAACGPAIMGFIHEMTSGWAIPLVLCISVCAIWTGVATLAARKEKIMFPSENRITGYC